MFSIPEFLRFIEEVETREAEAERKALEKAAKIVEAEAKRRIGHYQAQTGPFAPWAPLADSTLADKERHGYAPPDSPLLREGDLRDSIGHEVSGHEAIVGSQSDVAVYQELGTSKMPPRSFLGGAAFAKQAEVLEVLGQAYVEEMFVRGPKGTYQFPHFAPFRGFTFASGGSAPDVFSAVEDVGEGALFDMLGEMTLGAILGML